MINYIRSVMVACLAIVIVPACDSDEPSPYDEPLGDWVDDEGRMSFRGQLENAKAVNGFRVNGFRVNGFRVNGFRVNGFRVNGFRVNGSALNSPLMNNNKLKLKNQSNEDLEGEDLEDLRVDVDYEDPDTQEVTDFEVAQTEVETLGSGLVLQTVKRRQKPAGAWENACENNAKSILLKGAWDEESATLISTDPERTTWACAGAALGDCAIWGYIPGNTHNGHALGDYHQTCLRLKRADYCGEGHHHTENGHSIDVYDKLDVMAPETVGLWDVEAMWGPSGAICMNFTRKLDYTKDINDGSKEYIGCEIPDCVDVNADGVIDFADYPQALMADRTIPKWKVN